MVESTDGPEAEALPPVVTSPHRRRRALWGALAVLAVGAGALAVVANDDDGGGSPRLPIALGSQNAESKMSAPAAGGAADMALYAPFHYVAGDDLPLLGGTGPAYKLSGTVAKGDVDRLADALHLTGTPKHEDGFWRLTSDAGTLEVYEGGGGTWWYSSAQLMEPDYGTNDGSDGCAPDAKECAAVGGSTTTAIAGSSSSSGCEVDKCIDPVEPAPIVPPADLPSKAEAKTIALDLFAAIGTDVGDPKVAVDGPYEAWYVSIEPTVDGLAASGLYFNVSVGSKGEIVGAGGMLNAPELLGDYPTIDTHEAIERLNDGVAYGGARDTAGVAAFGSGAAEASTTAPDLTSTTVAVPPPDAAVSSGPTSSAGDPGDVACGYAASDDLATTDQIEPAIDPAVPVPVCPPFIPPEPVDVVLHQAERVLVLIAANDGSTDSYLVPGYRLRGDDENVVDVPAVDDQSLLPTPDPADTPKGPDTVPAVEPAVPDLPLTTLAER